ncbi:MAG: serine/threonine protein kinase [Armatimonadota bacterium]
MKTVTDRNGVRYELTHQIGRGGQGAVWAVKGGRLAVKIVPGGNEARRDRLRNQLSYVRRLPLASLCLAKPLELLREPHTGYVMELLRDMQPIEKLFVPDRGASPTVEWYLRGGSLRRRLTLLGRTAQVLAQLHGKGLAYEDPSPQNVFVSSDSEQHEVWLIDTDNLQYDSAPGLAVFTPGYGAPELVDRKAGASTLSDSYAFAVIAHQTLVLAHPFVGDRVNDGPPELEEQAFAGELPWIDDPHDDSNRAQFGVPRGWVLSKRLSELFEREFCAGRSDPRARPGMSEWAERLYTAADSNLTCPKCAATYYFDQETCPWCDEVRPAFAVARFLLFDPKANDGAGGCVQRPQGEKKAPRVVGHGLVAEGDLLTISRRLAFGTSDGPIHEPVVSVKLKGNRLRIRSLDGARYRLVGAASGKESEVGEAEKTLAFIKQRQPWTLHFGKSDTLHRVVSFSLRSRGEA